MPIHESNELDQGSPASFFLQAKKSFLIVPNSQEPPCPGTIFENKSPIFTVFDSTYSEMTKYHSTCSNINAIEICTSN
jgi:hypothetical protein